MTAPAEAAPETTAAPAPEAALSKLELANSTQPERAKSITETWSKVMDQLGPITDGDEAAEATEAAPEAEAEPAPEPKASKAKSKAAEKPKEAEPETVEAETPEEPPKTAGVRDIIQERRRLRAAFEAREKQRDAEHAARMAELSARETKHAPLMKLASAVESGDFDDIAAAVGEFLGAKELKTWESLNDEALKQVRDPHYKRVRDLERKAAEREAQDAEARKQREAHEQQAQQVAAERQWKHGIVEEIAAHEDPALNAMIAKRPRLVDGIYAIQNEHWKETGEVMSATDAAAVQLGSVIREFVEWSDFVEAHPDSPIVRKFMGDRGTPKKPVLSDHSAAQTSATGNPKAATSERRGGPSGPPKNVSQAQVAEAAGTKPLSPAQIMAKYKRQMEHDWEVNRPK